ncbi:toxin-coregulated pilus protein TcpS [Vibrio cholerae]|uniref:toxin-coregulated pilus protein TcpS n=1 Tax=Vibrio mimicus TaxID=674 RepID=UPI002F91CF5C
MNIKLSFISIAFLSLSFNVAANEFEKSQEHYKSVTDLKNKIEILELEKKITELSGEIRNARMPKIDKSAPVLSPQPVVKSSEELQKSIEHIEEELKVELAYLVNNGQQKKYTFNLNGKLITLVNGDFVNGWKFIEDQNKILFSKGNKVIDVN